MTKTAMVASGVLLTLVGIVLGLFLQGKRLIPHFKIFDNNDSPVTVGDSSFDGNSYYGWSSDDGITLFPNGKSSPGTLMNACNLPGSGMVAFDDGSGPSASNPQDIYPLTSTPLNITITHGDWSINITTGPGLTNLNIKDLTKSWGQPSFFGTVSNKHPEHIKWVDYVDSNGRPAQIKAKGGKFNAQIDFCFQ
jgi:hypothetical protein